MISASARFARATATCPVPLDESSGGEAVLVIPPAELPAILRDPGRLIAANGHAENQVIRIDPGPFVDPAATTIGEAHELVQHMDQWLDAVSADEIDTALPQKLVRNRPTGLADSCLAVSGERIVEPAVYDGQGRCHQLYPPHGDPRLAAGAPLTDDVLKCALKPIDPADYSRPLRADRLAGLKAIFPSGVCDFTKPGVGRQPAAGVWQYYQIP